MVEQQLYIETDSVLSPSDALSEDLPGLSDCAGSSTSSYPDLAPYTTEVLAFTLPARCDPDLRTPISTAGSPPFHHGYKLMSDYPAADSPNGQDPTPPGSSTMYSHWNNPQFEMNSHPSETSSPMHTPGHFGTDYYIAGRRTPIPPEPYLGVSGVSDSPHPAPISQPRPPYYLHPMPDQHSFILRAGHAMSMEPHSREFSRDITMSAPMLQDVPRVSSYRHPGDRHSPNDVPIKQERRSSQNMCTARDIRKHLGVIGNHRVRKPSSKNKSNKQSTSVEDHRNCNGDEVPPSLKDQCPDEERCIFDSRWRHRNKRGQDMWDSIQSDFLKQFDKNHGKEMLQMKFKRARSKYIQWLPRDEDILREAWKKVEQDRYQAILDLFHEMGGSRNMRLSPSDIEVKLVHDLKLEEHLFLDCFRDTDVRRRQNVSTKRRTSGRRGPDNVFVAKLMTSVDPRDALDEDELITQVHLARESPSPWETPSDGYGEMMDMHVWDNKAPVKVESGTTP
ncbi:hypothetical protein C2857_003446 [Epichloe festucae Fl1]|uniref:Uncharacterized protein n=1 Tax=Epichloe festucae (strain Fl1) TaxID=877507 RepID=A0A7U3SNL2_EPIFF|nr:hypothetical protein C2857_003446 [Epichloe festucae Fl1]